MTNEKQKEASPALGVASVRHFTVHWEVPHVFGYRPIYAPTKREAKLTHLKQYPTHTITHVHEGPVVFEFKYA